MTGRTFTVVAALLAAVPLVSCSGPEGPGETVDRFLQCVADRNIEEAMEILAPQEQSKMDEDVLAELDLRAWTIDEVRISSDGTEAEVEFSITITRPSTGETTDSMEWKLHRNDSGCWRVVDI